VTAILLAVAVLVLVLPWYPVVRSQTVTATFTYTYQVPDESYQSVTVYSLPNSVTLQGFFQSGATLSKIYQTLGDVTLESGAIVTVEVQQCQFCSTSLSKDFGDKASIFSMSGGGTGDFIAPESGQYQIGIGNVGFTQERVSSILITANVPRNSMQTQSGYNTVDVTEYSVATVPVYSVLGIMTSAVILALVAILVVVAILFNQGIITMSSRRRRKR
jgi:hypothetical protein